MSLQTSKTSLSLEGILYSQQPSERKASGELEENTTFVHHHQTVVIFYATVWNNGPSSGGKQRTDPHYSFFLQGENKTI